MTDSLDPHEQLRRCDAWLKQHQADPLMSPRAIDSVSLLRRKAQQQLLKALNP